MYETNGVRPTVPVQQHRVHTTEKGGDSNVRFDRPSGQPSDTSRQKYTTYKLLFLLLSCFRRSKSTWGPGSASESAKATKVL